MGRFTVICLLVMILIASGCSLLIKPQTNAGKDLNDLISTPDTTSETSSGDDVLVKTYNEGDLVSFPKLKATDPDGNKISFVFSKPLNSSGEWQTRAGDAGTYDSEISISDGSLSAVKKVRIIVVKSNQAPVIIIPAEITVNEGENVELNPAVTDADNDNVAVTYDGWMTSKSKQTGFDDAGTYAVRINADDGMHNSTAEVKIIVNNMNRAPVFTAGSFD